MSAKSEAVDRYDSTASDGYATEGFSDGWDAAIASRPREHSDACDAWADMNNSGCTCGVEASDDIERAVTAILNRGNVVHEWPDDEAAAYRDNGGFAEGMAAVDHVRFEKIAALFGCGRQVHEVSA